MADVNYVNPSAIMPKQGWQPEGFMGGMQYAQQLGDYTDQMSLSKLMSQMGASKEMEDLTLGAPVRASGRLKDIASNNATAATIGGLKQAEMGLQQDLAKRSRAGVDDNISMDHAKHLSGLDEIKQQDFRRQVTGAAQLGAIMQQAGPAGAAMAAQAAPRFGIDPKGELFQALIQNPQAVIQHLNSVDQALQGKLWEQREKDSEAFRRQQYSSDSSAASARYTADRAYDRVVDKPNAGGAPTTDKLFAAALARMNELRESGQPVPPSLIEHIQLLQKQRIAERSAAAAQGQAGTADILDRAPPPAVSPPALPGVTAGEDAQMKGIVERSGQKYEPNKYQYRINPTTGKAEKRPK